MTGIRFHMVVDDMQGAETPVWGGGERRLYLGHRFLEESAEYGAQEGWLGGGQAAGSGAELCFAGTISARGGWQEIGRYLCSSHAILQGLAELNIKEGCWGSRYLS